MSTTPEISALAKGVTSSFANMKIPAINYPEITAIRIPSPEQRQKFESAGVLVSRLATRIRHWRAKLPQNQQPVVLAILANGTCVKVSKLSEESHHGILVEGHIDSSPCMLLCHQSMLQLLCYVEEVKKEEERREIGFHVISRES